MFWVLFQRMETCFEEEEEQVTAGLPSPRRGTRPSGREKPGVEGEDGSGAPTFNSSNSSSSLRLCTSARVGLDIITRRRGERGGEKRAKDGRMDGRQLSIALLSPANSLSPLSQVREGREGKGKSGRRWSEASPPSRETRNQGKRLAGTARPTAYRTAARRW